MMRRFALISGLACALSVLATAASAQPVSANADQDARLEGHVDGACRMGVPTALSTNNVSVSTLSQGSAEFSIDQLVGPDSIPLAASLTLSIPAVCTQAHTLTISSLKDGLRTEEVVPSGSGFRGVIDYSVGVDWAGQNSAFTASGADVVTPVPDAAVGDVTVTIQIPGGGDPAVAGFYSDEIILQLGVAG
jgi:hypothetical protein